MPTNTSYSFSIASTADLQTDLALIDVGGADAGTGNTYTFNFTQSVTLSQQLYAVNLTDKTSTLVINGNNNTLSGNDTYNGLFVYSGTVDINDLTIAHAVAIGGAGGAGGQYHGGGGGAGLGGGLFIASGGAVVLNNVGFSQDSAVGGAGGSGSGSSNFGAGGGGLEGGAGGTQASSGGGGIGLSASGGAPSVNGGAGIVPGAGRGGDGGQFGGASGGGGGGGGNGNGSGGGGINAGTPSGATGGNGGFGGGGGGGFDGGKGGFGGGGGGGFGGGQGGFGGGGGSGTSTDDGRGGFGGGNGATDSINGGGGGGLGAGGDIYIARGGSLTIGAGSLGMGTVAGGAGGASGGTAGAGLGSSLFIDGIGGNFNNTVTLSPGAGNTLTIAGTIADEAGSTVASGLLTANQGASAGSGVLAIASGTVVLDAANTYTGGTMLNGGTLELGKNNAAGTGAITFGTGAQTLQLDATVTGTANSFANTLNTIAAGDAIDLRGLAFASGATATISNGTLTVTSGGNSESFTLLNPGAMTFSVTSDGASGTAGTLVTAAPTNLVTPTTLFSFNGANGTQPIYDHLIADASGNLYGTTSRGGANNNGTIYEIAYDSSTGAYSNAPITLASFTDGGHPYNALYRDASGNLFGTTYTGGSGNTGSVFELGYNSTSGTYNNTVTTLASFSYAYPSTSLIADAAGNLYGTTSVGGANSAGSVFELVYNSMTGTYSDTPTTLASLDRSTSGTQSFAGLIADTAGNLYGTTEGANSTGGTVFEIAFDSTTGTYSSTPIRLATFATERAQGSNGALFADASGNLYGTTYGGGANNAGMVFELVRNPATGAFTPTTLASFNTADGAGPTGTLIQDAAGNLYGVTSGGGANGVGTVFKLAYDSATGSYSDTPTTLATFDTTHGSTPYGGLHADAAGNLIGTTFSGGDNNDGTVFEVMNSGFVVPAVDATAPIFQSASVSGNSLVLTYSEPLDATHLPPTNAFNVLVNGASDTVTGASVSGATLTLTLGTAVVHGDVVKLSYSDPTTGDDANATQDGAGNDAASLSNQAVTNTAANVAPTLTGDLMATVNEGGSVVIGTTDLNFSDPDNNAAGETFTVSNLSHGTVLVNGIAATTFTGTQLAADQVSFQHDGSETTAASFSVSVEDGNEDHSTPVAQTFNLTVNPVNDDPAATGVPTDVTVIGDQASFVDLSAITFSDVDSGTAAITLKITASAGTLNGISSGSVMVSGASTATLTLTGTAANIDDFLNRPYITYTSASGAAGSSAATLTLTANDGGHTGSGGGTDVVLGTVNVDVREAPSLVVTTLSDVVDAHDGKTSLREAITYANAHAGADTITFASNLTGTIRLDGDDGGTLSVTDTLTIDGGDRITISGDVVDNDATLAGTDITDLAATSAQNLADNIRLIDASADITLRGLTLTGGHTTGSDERGGAIRAAVQKTITIDHSTVSGNGTSGATSFGGAVYGSTIVATDSTFTDNHSGAGGGAIAGSSLTLTNSTVSGNSSVSYGGGVTASGINLTNTTITGNSTTSVGGVGGGVYAETGTVTNSIILGNVAKNASGDEIVYTYAKVGGNIIGRDGGGGADVFSGSDDVGDTTAAAVFAHTVDLGNGVLAGLLANNGGPVQTVALKASATNPALDAADLSAPSSDARGYERVDFAEVANGSSGAGADLGAFEVQGDLADTTPPTITVATIAGDDVVNAAEGAASIKVSGATTKVEDGQTVTLTLKSADGLMTLQTLTTTVTDGAYSVTIPPGTTPAFPDGPYLITADVSDKAGHAATEAQRSITVDTHAPSAPSIALKNDTGTLSTDRITLDPSLSYTLADTTDTLFYATDGKTFSSLAPVFTTDGTADGMHTVSVEEKDAAGNVSAISSLTFTLDTIVPTLTKITAAPVSGRISEGNKVAFTLAFGEGVHVTGGTPTLALNDGGSAIYDAAATAALHDSSKLVFSYVVSSNDTPTAGLAVKGLVANAATVDDVAGNHADLSHVAATFSGLTVGYPGLFTEHDDTVTLPGAGSYHALAGNDTIRLNAPNEKVYGDAGNDTFYVNATGDTIVELAEQGTDTVVTPLSSFQLSANVENLTYTGNSNFTGVGNDSNNFIVGGNGSDHLVGGNGDDRLLARAGLPNVLDGGAGNDTYYIEAVGDKIIENADGGIDSVQTWMTTFRLPNNVENLVFVANLAHTGIGNALSNTFTGVPANDTFVGGGGNDVFNYRAARNGHDTITDFNADNTNLAEHDHIDLTGRGLSFERLVLTNASAGLTVGIPGGDSIFLKSVHALDAGDFFF